MLIKVMAVQARVGQHQTLEEKLHIFKQRPDFVCLPEYYLIDESVTDYHRAALHRKEYLEYLQRLSDELTTCLIAGTVVEAREDKLYNTASVIDCGHIIGSYRKRNPVPRERERGISPGDTPFVFELDGVRVGVLVCGDVFSENCYREMGQLEVDVIFIPTTSPYRPADSLTQKRLRDHQYFLAGAELSGAFVVKTCGVGTLFGRPLQGRSLIAAPWGILTQIHNLSEGDKGLLTATLDIDELRDFRAKYRRKRSGQLLNSE